MLANALVQMSGCVPDIICVAKITLKFVDYAQVLTVGGVYSFGARTWLIFFDWNTTGLICSPIFAHRFCISRVTELAYCWSLNGSGTTMLEVPSLALAGALILLILRRNLVIEGLSDGTSNIVVPLPVKYQIQFKYCLGFEMFEIFELWRRVKTQFFDTFHVSVPNTLGRTSED